MFITVTWNVWPLTVSSWGGGLFADVFNFLSSAPEALLSVSISSEDISDDDVDDVEFFKNSYMLFDSLFMWQYKKAIENKCQNRPNAPSNIEQHKRNGQNDLLM